MNGKRSTGRLAIALTLAITFSLPLFARQKQTAAECSLAILTKKPQKAKAVCDLNTVRTLADRGVAFEQNQMGIASVLVIDESLSVSDAVQWFQKAAANAYVPAEINLGVMYENGWGTDKNYAAALNWFHQASEQGSALADYNLGSLYLNGQGVKQDYHEAFRYFQKSAQAGDPGAESNLGYLYDRGLGTQPDIRMAIQWYTRAADDGWPMAQHNLGDLYMRGEGVPQNYSTAAAWFEKSAQAGYTGAEIKLAYLLSEGRGVPKDLEAAYSWLLAAAKAGDTRGADLQRSIASQLNADQLRMATERADSVNSQQRSQISASAFVP
ncbi:MAG TPA: tetratricopeptide repeat protein [Terriglobales bacterium]|nr:tetratricopeptide repeat protein [Terriglobales bacterium]